MFGTIRYGLSQENSRSLALFTFFFLLWTGFWALIWGIAAFAGYVLEGSFLNNVFLWAVLLIITSGPVYILQMLWANRLKQISNEVKKWNTLYKKKQMEYKKVSKKHKKSKQDEMVKTAKNYEDALRFQDAAQIYEELGLWKEAGRARMREIELKAPKSVFKNHNIQIGDTTVIQDSVIQRSKIGGK